MIPNMQKGVVRMRYDAMEVYWLPITIRKTEGYFCNERIKPDSVPDRFTVWEVADADGNGEIARYRPWILVNFWGTFITENDLPVDIVSERVGYVDQDEDCIVTGTRYYSFDEICEMSSAKE